MPSSTISFDIRLWQEGHRCTRIQLACLKFYELPLMISISYFLSPYREIFSIIRLNMAKWNTQQNFIGSDRVDGLSALCSIFTGTIPCCMGIFLQNPKKTLEVSVKIVVTQTIPNTWVFEISRKWHCAHKQKKWDVEVRLR